MSRSPEYSDGYRRHIRNEKAKARKAGAAFEQPFEPPRKPTPIDLTKQEAMISSIEAMPDYDTVISLHMKAIMDFWKVRNKIFNGANSTSEVRAEMDTWLAKYEADGPLPDEINSILGSITRAFDEARKSRMRG